MVINVNKVTIIYFLLKFTSRGTFPSDTWDIYWSSAIKSLSLHRDSVTRTNNVQTTYSVRIFTFFG